MDVKKFLIALAVVAMLVGAWYALKSLGGGGC